MLKAMRKAVYWVVTILTPIVIVLLIVRLLLTPVFIQIEYRMPYFPKDSYGFTMDERLYWSNVSRQYLLNKDGIEFLSKQELPEDKPLYNARELRHMEDVKQVVKWSMRVLVVSAVTLLVIGMWAGSTKQTKTFLMALKKGAWLTIGLIVMIFAFIALSFDTFFIEFHRVFFEEKTWLFLYSDTLIRLFPERFWMDAFVAISVLSILIAGALLFTVNRKLRKV